MKLQYVVLGSDPLRIKCFYEEGEKYGEFYIVQTTRHSYDVFNPTDKLGVRGEFEIQAKDKDYGIDLLQGLAQALLVDLDFASFVTSMEQMVKDEDICSVGMPNDGTVFCSKHKKVHNKNHGK